MKVVLFCGGLGLRLQDYANHIPDYRSRGMISMFRRATVVVMETDT
jgi:hypothetical protein